MSQIHYKTDEELAAFCYVQAQKLFSVRHSLGIVVDTVEELAELLFNLEIDKMNRDLATDKLIEFNDEIVSIEELDEEETIDLTVSKDSLFYANSILTKNSFGLPMSLDWFVAIVTNEDLMEMNRQMLILLKTRYGNKQNKKSQLVGIDFDYMRYFDVETDEKNNDNVKEVANVVGKTTPATKTQSSLGKGIPDDIEWD